MVSLYTHPESERTDQLLFFMKNTNEDQFPLTSEILMTSLTHKCLTKQIHSVMINYRLCAITFLFLRCGEVYLCFNHFPFTLFPQSSLTQKHSRTRSKDYHHDTFAHFTIQFKMFLFVFKWSRAHPPLFSIRVWRFSLVSLSHSWKRRVAELFSSESTVSGHLPSTFYY